MRDSMTMGQTQAPRQRPGPFGPAWALLPKDQEVLMIDEYTPAYDAMERMIDHAYSQLPVTSNGIVVGVFTWRSFGKRASDLRDTKIKAAELPAREFTEPAKFISPEMYIDTETDWSDLDYVLVGSEEKLVGILCVSDVFARLNDFTEAFVLIYEIEHEVRDLIRDVVGEEALCELIRNMSVPQNTRPPKILEDCTFDQYRQLISTKSNWDTFEAAFGSSRDLVDADFKGITELRNTVFHFRRAITPRDTDRLRRFRDSLRHDRDLLERSRRHPVQAASFSAAVPRCA